MQVKGCLITSLLVFGHALAFREGSPCKGHRGQVACSNDRTDVIVCSPLMGQLVWQQKTVCGKPICKHGECDIDDRKMARAPKDKPDHDGRGHEKGDDHDQRARKDRHDHDGPGHEKGDDHDKRSPKDRHDHDGPGHDTGDDNNKGDKDKNNKNGGDNDD